MRIIEPTHELDEQAIHEITASYAANERTHHSAIQQLRQHGLSLRQAAERLELVGD